MPMDSLEESTTGASSCSQERQFYLGFMLGNSDIILANSQFTSRVFKSYFSIPQTPRVIYPGINISAYEGPLAESDPDIQAISS